MELESIQIADGCGGHQFGPEVFARNFLERFAGHAFDRLKNLVHAEEPPEIHFLARQVRHAGAGGFERKHQRPFEVIFGAAQLFRADEFIFQLREFLRHQANHLFRLIERRARIDR